MRGIRKWLFEFSKRWIQEKKLPPPHFAIFPFLLSTVLLAIAASILLWIHHFDASARLNLVKIIRENGWIDLANAVILIFVVTPLIIASFNAGGNTLSIARTKKYSIVVFCISFYLSVRAFVEYAQSTTEIQDLKIYLLPINGIILFIFQIISYVMINKNPSTKPGRFLMFMWRLRTFLVPTALVAAYGFGFGELAFMVLPLRFMTGEKLRQRPILFLRSFLMNDIDTVYSKVVAKACSKYGVVVAVGHEGQFPGELNKKLTYLDWAYTFIMDNDVWEAEIEKLLVEASGVMIEISVKTKGVEIELKKALNLSNKKKIILLKNRGSNSVDWTTVGTLSTFQTITYSLDEADLKAAVQQLGAWVKSL